MSPKSTTLLEKLSSIDFLKKSWATLNKANKASKGVTDETIEDFSNNLETNLKVISSQISKGKYQFSKVRPVALKKERKNDNETQKYRPLRIAEVRDRLVQKALTNILDEILSGKFDLDNECSFAYRKNRNVEQAILKMQDYYHEGYKIILEADIEKFFDNVDNDTLTSKILESLPDDSINDLFKDALRQELDSNHKIEKKVLEEYFSTSETGIPQGNPLSPLLANIYLSDFDKRMSETNYKMIRYADDFIIMCKNKEDAKSAYDDAKSILEQIGLKTHDMGEPNDENSKTRIVNPTIHKFSFLSIRFDGIRCWVNNKKFDSFKDKIKMITTLDSNKRMSLLEILKSLKNTLDGWVASYHYVDLSFQLPELDKLVNRQLYLLLDSYGLSVKKSALQEIRFKDKSRSVLALSDYQRKNLGIPLCETTLNKLLDKKAQKVKDKKGQ